MRDKALQLRKKAEQEKRIRIHLEKTGKAGVALKHRKKR
jgi:hypothetical protein